MKNPLHIVLLLMIIAVSFLTGTWYSRQNSAENGGSGQRRALYYVDPMNPAHTSTEPGVAPCGMKMEPVYADDEGTAAGTLMPEGTVRINSGKQQLMGVRVIQVEEAPHTYVIRTFGKVTVDETRVYRLNAFTDGWILKAYSNSTGSLVMQDEPLATFYSRDFITAEQAYFYALNTMDRVKRGDKVIADQLSLTQYQVRSAEESLENLGMSKLQIQELAQTREITQDIIISAPATSFVLARNVSPGQKFERGAELYRLADLSHIWVEADLFENEAQFVRAGETVRVCLPHQNREFETTVSKVLPIFDPASRSLKVRLETDNFEYTLRPDMFVDVELPVTLPPSVNVPVDAVLDAGTSKTVFVDRGSGFFEPRSVKTGWRYGDRVQIVEGLMPGERIAVSGTFFIDSESRMKMAATGAHRTKSRDPVCGLDVDESTAKMTGNTSMAQGKTYYFCSDQCKQEFDANPAEWTGEGNGGASGAKRQGTGNLTISIDPVCKMPLYTGKANAIYRQSEHLGSTYFFCSDFCKRKFDQQPDLFVREPGRPSSVLQSSPATAPTGEGQRHD
jgi:membrane fusion protein, copper/silver efflux system